MIYESSNWFLELNALARIPFIQRDSLDHKDRTNDQKETRTPYFCFSWETSASA